MKNYEAMRAATAAAVAMSRNQRLQGRAALERNAQQRQHNRVADRQARRNALERNAQRRKAEIALARSHRNYQPGSHPGFPAGSKARA